MRPDPHIQFWEGKTKPLPGGMTLIRCGGHFPGGTVLHWPDGAGGRGALLSGDILTVVPDRRYVSFMYSYPNLIPLPAGRSAGSSRPCHPSRSTGSTAPGGTGWCRRMAKRRWRARPSATSPPWKAEEE